MGIGLIFDTLNSDKSTIHIFAFSIFKNRLQYKMKNKNQVTRIFVVEDDFMYQRMIKYVMELNPDHEVHVFSSGQECLQQLHLQLTASWLVSGFENYVGRFQMRPLRPLDC